MSQNKTVFPGVGQEGEDFSPHRQQAPYSDNYSRPAYANRSAGTVFPGMEGMQPGRPQRPEQPQPCRPTGNHGNKPIVGFLYSVSRTAAGEFWPVYIGQNVIGCAPSCDIVLKEGTVSQRHAILHINKMKKPEKLEATISDCQSTNGTMLNGNSVSVARPPECINGDVITIGENYELLFVLIDVKALGLTTAEQFYAINDDDDDDYDDRGNSRQNMNNANRPTFNQQDFPPRFNGPDPSPYGGASKPSGDSTMGLDPTAGNGFNHGGTMGME